MPIEIRELIIKTNVVDKTAIGVQDKHPGISRREIEKIKKEIIESCLMDIMDKINKGKER